MRPIVFDTCPLLMPYRDQCQAATDEFIKYKHSVPTYGAVLVSADKKKVRAGFLIAPPNSSVLRGSVFFIDAATQKMAATAKEIEDVLLDLSRCVRQWPC